jgi:hypothetical protein
LEIAGRYSLLLRYTPMPEALPLTSLRSCLSLWGREAKWGPPACGLGHGGPYELRRRHIAGLAPRGLRHRHVCRIARVGPRSLKDGRIGCCEFGMPCEIGAMVHLPAVGLRAPSCGLAFPKKAPHATCCPAKVAGS